MIPFLLRFRLLGAAALLLALRVPLSATRLVDDAEGGAQERRLAQYWYAYNDPHSSVTPQPFVFTPEGHVSAHAAKVEVSLGAGSPVAYAGFGAGFPATDFSGFAGVRFWARGRGGWVCQVATRATAAENNHYAAPLGVGAAWTQVEIPFSDLVQTWGSPAAWDPAEVTSVNWTCSGAAGTQAWLAVDDVEFYAASEASQAQADPNAVLPQPKVNQDGYRLNDPKAFAIVKGAGHPLPGDGFSVLDETGREAFRGHLVQRSSDDSASGGESVLEGDFSGLRAAGRYRVRAAGLSSQPFVIGPDVYRPLFKDALHCFRVIRCGTALDDPALGLKHPACHLGDAKRVDGGQTDLTGGWHNAEDYGKWVVEASVSCAWMLWLERLHGPALGADRARLLEEARWGLEWMLKMQLSDGSVLHKVDAQDHFCSGTPPQDDPYQGRRLAQRATSQDAANFTGVMALASRVYATDDPPFAQRCRDAAGRAWAWLEGHPDVVDFDPDYQDYTHLDPTQRQLWALGEMASLGDDPSLKLRFAQAASAQALPEPSWGDTRFFGLLAALQDPAQPRREALRAQLRQLCERLAQQSAADGYGSSLLPQDYHWESNETLLDRAGALLCGYAIEGRPAYLAAGLRQLDWLLGLNSLDFSFVAGHGGRSLSHPWHWTYTTYHVLLPGWAAGGPNQYPQGADPLLTRVIKRGAPPAKCYVDAATLGQGSWAVNEGETSENAALVFSAGFLTEPGR